ncbi:Uncharacterised protein [Leclercia adecarboxylata]|uniref:Uncharacterized protein n=1 Tax=Leclercia adecarboxylata TaxID=83655 RepID=A0A4U9I4X1_9ENTR|nr:Uncharacterised protein [Leclercia adecarboxylata]
MMSGAPNRLSFTFLAQPACNSGHPCISVCQRLRLARGEVYSQPAQFCRSYPKSPYSRPPVLQTQYHWVIRSLPGPWRFKEWPVRYRTEGRPGLRHLPANGGGVWRAVEGGRGDADPAHQSRRDADHLVAEKVLRLLPLLPQSTGTSSIAPAANISCLPCIRSATSA